MEFHDVSLSTSSKLLNTVDYPLRPFRPQKMIYRDFGEFGQNYSKGLFPAGWGIRYRRHHRELNLFSAGKFNSCCVEKLVGLVEIELFLNTKITAQRSTAVQFEGRESILCFAQTGSLGTKEPLRDAF